MGDVKKVVKSKWFLPVFGALTGGLGYFSAAWNVGFSAVQGFAYGSMLQSIIGGGKKRNELGATQERNYALGRNGNWPDRHRTVPIVYGKARIKNGALFFCGPPGQNQDRGIALCEGPVNAVTDVRINGLPVDDYSGCTADAYTGALDQTLDTRLSDGGYKGGVRGLAYVAASIVASEQLQGDPVISALVKGREVDVWTGAAFETQWSENPWWCIRDYLLNFVGFPQSYIDEYADEWVAVAGHADEVMPDEYDYGDNVALGCTVTGGTNPELATDGSVAQSGLGWWRVCAQNDPTLYELGVLDFGSDKLINLIIVRLHNFQDDHVFLNIKVEVKPDGGAYSTVCDGTGLGLTFRGDQYYEIDPTTARYIRVSGAGSYTHPNFHVAELEAYEAVPAKRYRMSAVLETQRGARDVLKDMLTACCGAIVDTGVGLRPICDSDAHTPEITVAKGDMVEESVEYGEIDGEPFNAVTVKFSEPIRDYSVIEAICEMPNIADPSDIRDLTINADFICSKSAAARIANQAMSTSIKARRTASWTGELGALAFDAGDLAEVTDDEVGMTDYQFRLNDITRMSDGKSRMQFTQYVPSIYTDNPGVVHIGVSTIKLALANDAPNHVGNLTLAEDKTQPGDGAWIPCINVTFDRPTTGVDWAYADVELSDDGGATYKVIGRCSDGTYRIPELQAGTTYRVRVVSVSAAGIKALVSTAPWASIALAGKASAPTDVTGFNYSMAQGVFELVWNSAYDANNDLKHYEIRDGVSWPAGTILATDIMATRYTLKSTKRSYDLWIKAFDRSLNESANATEKTITIAAPAMGAAPTCFQKANSYAVMVLFSALANTNILKYSVHVGATSGFTPSAANLVSTAATGFAGLVTAYFIASPDTTYYVKICAQDYLSEAVGDQYDYPSSVATVTTKKVRTEDCDNGIITTALLSTDGIIVGGGGTKAPFISILDGSANTVGYWGYDPVRGKYGIYSKDYLLIGDPANPWFIAQDGVARIAQSVYVGAVGETDVIMSSADMAVNLMPNGDFSMVKGTGTAGTNTDFLPDFYWDKTAAGGGLTINVRADGDAYFIGSRYSVSLLASTTAKSYMYNNTPIPCLGSKKYFFDAWVCKGDAGNPNCNFRGKVTWLDKDGASISEYDWFTEASVSQTTATSKSGSATSPATAAYMRVVVYAGFTASGTGGIIVSGIKVARGKVLTAWSPPPIAGRALPSGVAIGEKGISVINSGVLTARIGDISNLSDGLGGTFAAGTRGVRFELGNFALINDAGDLMLGIDGATDELYLSNPVALAVMDAGAQALITDTDDPNTPHEFHFGFVASDTTTLSTSTPITWAHGQANAPMMPAQIRGYDDGTSAYSKWHDFPLTIAGINLSPNPAYSFICCYYMSVDTTNIRVDANVLLTAFDNPGGDHCTQVLQGFDSTNKANFWLRKADHTLSNIWDKLQLRYFIMREGGT